MPHIYAPDDGAGTRRLLNRIGGTNPIRALQEQALSGTGLFRAAAPLPPEAGEQMDEIVTEVGSDRLVVAAALIEFVERPLLNWWSVYTKQHEKISKQGRARRTMKPGGLGARSLRDRTAVSTPIYATEEDFDFHERFMAVASASGVSLEDDSMRAAIENINEAVEDAAINGPGVNFNAVSTAYGLENAPNANTVTLSGTNPAWDHASKTGQEIQNDYFAMRDACYADNHYGPFVMFVEKNYESPLGKLFGDGTTTQPITVREMLLKDPNLLDIRVSDQLADDKVFLVEMKTSTCGIYVGQDTTWIAFPPHRFDHEFLALACLVPYFRDDYDGGSGIVEATV